MRTNPARAARPAANRDRIGATQKLARRLGAALIIVGVLPAQAPAGATLDIAIEGLRSDVGTLRVCVTAQADRFPNCQDDPASLRASVPAARPFVHFEHVPAGNYAVAVIHDANDNKKLDRRFAIPTEGIGFSRNPAIRFGPPAFKAAAFPLTGTRRETVKMKYFL